MKRRYFKETRPNGTIKIWIHQENDDGSSGIICYNRLMHCSLSFFYVNRKFYKEISEEEAFLEKV